MEPEDEFVAEYFASIPADERPLPSPHLIWWRAEIARRRRLAERSVAPVRFAQWACGGAIAIFLAAGLVPMGLGATVWLGIGAALLLLFAAAICATVLA